MSRFWRLFHWCALVYLLVGAWRLPVTRPARGALLLGALLAANTLVRLGWPVLETEPVYVVGGDRPWFRLPAPLARLHMEWGYLTTWTLTAEQYRAWQRGDLL